MKTLGCKVDSDTYEEFLDNCTNNDTNPSKKLRDLVEYYNENGDPDEQEPQIEYRDKEVIKEVIKEVPGPVQYRDKEVPGPVQYIERPKPKPATYSCGEPKCPNVHDCVE